MGTGEEERARRVALRRDAVCFARAAGNENAPPIKGRSYDRCSRKEIGNRARIVTRFGSISH